MFQKKKQLLLLTTVCEFNVLPFGLCNSPATFQSFMTHVLQGLEWDISLVYIDDLIIFPRTYDEHLLHLAWVFQCLRQANVTLNPSKCHFVKPEVEYLGHIVLAGLKPSPSKIHTVTEFPLPSNIMGVKAFLGLCNYYRRFIKEDTYQLSVSIETLKQALVSAPILAYPDFSLSLHLYVDASQTIRVCALNKVQE